MYKLNILADLCLNTHLWKSYVLNSYLFFLSNVLLDSRLREFLLLASKVLIDKETNLSFECFKLIVFPIKKDVLDFYFFI